VYHTSGLDFQSWWDLIGFLYEYAMQMIKFIIISQSGIMMLSVGILKS